ncbi:phage holin family protein [Leclercia adecarboxylata]|uniref:Phage holin family protein n=1 Tax=Leclercia adecarboxylata TaxID=83655 RepID=A0A9X4BD77_9ENTR|nr:MULTISPECIES: phage holin family protein [Leclercia]ELO5586671.1 phage holin family protein [Escherichia coli]AXF65015.1 holin [Leclercia sp. W17]MBD1404246.1 phage holin family protein [Leclercia adecarboxylata]MDC6621875.1 phage holin family protein [Leclercia adecarboxylata]MDC6632947.1 phage holin family protein [Leclercia adecarboxylata]
MKKSIMQDRPDTWAVMLAWLVNHKNEAGYSVLAFVMSILATSRGAKSKWKDRIAGATMCGILCFFAQPTLTAIWAIFNWNFPPELCWPISAGVGYVGVDSLFAYARRRLGLNEPGEKANADPQ